MTQQPHLCILLLSHSVAGIKEKTEDTKYYLPVYKLYLCLSFNIFMVFSFFR